MAIDWGALKFPKGPPRKTVKAKAKRQHAAHVKSVRATVFAAARHRCVQCGQLASHLHEQLFRSRGGKVSEQNSVPLCAACHMKAHRLRVRG